MKSTTPSYRPERGFTLIEIMVVLGILMLMVGLGSKGVGMYNDSTKLQQAADEIKFQAKSAWRSSVKDQNSWQMVFSGHNGQTVEIQPAQELPDDQAAQKAAEGTVNGGDGKMRTVFESDLTFRMKHFGDVQWQAPKPDRWVFQGSGICEPITIRIDRDNQVNGKQEWVEMTFDPLTAGVQTTDFSE
jgi:prepilin-type N-terminal cleavage/methylation domain-containing protein